jgi:hypothetical protein
MAYPDSIQLFKNGRLPFRADAVPQNNANHHTECKRLQTVVYRGRIPKRDVFFGLFDVWQLGYRADLHPGGRGFETLSAQLLKA